MRDVILDRVRPLVDRLAADLADMLFARFEQHINQLELAFDVASSAYASDLEIHHGTSTDDQTVTPNAATPAAADTGRGSRRATPPSRRAAAATRARPVKGAPTADANVARAARLDPPVQAADRGDRSAAREDVPAVTSHGKPRQRAVMRCKKCGELGKRSDSCGITHNVSTSPATRDSTAQAVARAPATSPIKAPPLAAPAASLQSKKQQRAAMLRNRNARTEPPPLFVDPADFDPDEDRREEFRDLSILTLLRKS